MRKENDLHLDGASENQVIVACTCDNSMLHRVKGTLNRLLMQAT